MYGYDKLDEAGLREEEKDLRAMNCVTPSQIEGREKRLTEIEWQRLSRKLGDGKMVTYEVEFSGMLTITGRDTKDAMEKLNVIIGSAPNILFESIVINKK